MIEKIEDSLNGGYGGLYGEVVTEDCYRLRGLKFIPDIIFDFGANVGCFTRFARELFPDAKIIAVEPDPDNFKNLVRFTPTDNVFFVNKAIGTGMIWKCEQDINGAHESYLSSGLGYPFKEGEPIPKINETETKSIMPDEVINTYLSGNLKSVCKIDIEGNENIIFTHEPSMIALRKMDYVTMEIHWGALSGDLRDEVCQKTFEALASFIPTHNCILINTMFYAIKR